MKEIIINAQKEKIRSFEDISKFTIDFEEIANILKNDVKVKTILKAKIPLLREENIFLSKEIVESLLFTISDFTSIGFGFRSLFIIITLFYCLKKLLLLRTHLVYL
ncbi:MAG: hypothetical protein WAR79_07110 [Melioribacteraceae bacterium]